MTFPINGTGTRVAPPATPPTGQGTVEENRPLIQPEASDDEGFVDLYDPSLQNLEEGQLTVDTFTDIEVEEDFEDLMAPEQDASPQRGRELAPWQNAIMPPDPALDRKLDDIGSQMSTEPKSFLKFVAQNTNPQRSWFGFRNLLSILNDIIHFRKPMMVLNRNCVYCARTVDRTLGQFAGQKDDGPPRLYQVAERNQGDFMLLMHEVDKESRIIPSDVREQGVESFVDALKGHIGQGKRGCLSMPVMGYPFNHAMNVVHTHDDKCFVLCGQQGKVYDLDDPGDRAHFWQRYGGDHNTVQVVPTGDAPQARPRGTTTGPVMNDVV